MQQKPQYLSQELKSKNFNNFIQSLDLQLFFSKNTKPVPYKRVLDTIFLNIETHDISVAEIIMNEKTFKQILSIPSLKNSVEREMNINKLKKGIRGIYHKAIIRVSKKIPKNNILGLSEIKHRAYSLIEGIKE
jgi:hypothetical protein